MDSEKVCPLYPTGRAPLGMLSTVSQRCKSDVNVNLLAWYDFTQATRSETNRRINMHLTPINVKQSKCHTLFNCWVKYLPQPCSSCDFRRYRPPCHTEPKPGCCRYSPPLTCLTSVRRRCLTASITCRRTLGVTTERTWYPARRI